MFENNEKSSNMITQKFKLPPIDALEKIPSKLSAKNINKNQPDADFMEKILLDFGIEGRIKQINNGPVVSLYEFEPAPGIKVSKIMNISDDLARNTSSTLHEFQSYWENTVELKFRMRVEKEFF